MNETTLPAESLASAADLSAVLLAARTRALHLQILACDLYGLAHLQTSVGAVSVLHRAAREFDQLAGRVAP